MSNRKKLTKAEAGRLGGKATVKKYGPEHMRTIGQYRIGVIVSYNAAPPVKGRGSCTFLHIWTGPGSTTAGCTALDAGELLTVESWLEKPRKPALVQLPSRDYARLRRAWALP